MDLMHCIGWIDFVFSFDEKINTTENIIPRYMKISI
jgi:hypothetical protein